MRAAVAVAGCLLLGAAACADEERREASAFSASANRICAQAFGGSGEAGRVDLAREAGRWERGIDRLAALEAASGDARRFRTMIVHLRRMARGVRAAEAADDESVLPKVIAAVVEGRRASALARQLGLAACVLSEQVRQPPRDPERLRDAARALVPPGMRITRTLDCDEESCLLTLDAGRVDAVRASERALAARGWTGIRRSGRVSEERWVVAGRNDLRATFQFPARNRPPCDVHRDAPFCADTLWLHRVEIPELPG